MAEVGSEVTQLKPGHRVGVYYLQTRGQCHYCLAGEEEICPTAQLTASYGIRPLTQTYALEDANCVHERVTANDISFRAVLTPV